MEPGYNGTISEVLTRIEAILLQKKIELLKLGMILPDSLISEMGLFVSRNNIIDGCDVNKNSLSCCCPNCLKAHALNYAKKLGMNKSYILALQMMIEGNIGHNGYYLDGEELIKVIL